VIFAAIVAGALISLLISVPEAIKNYMLFRAMKKENIALREELANLKRAPVAPIYQNASNNGQR
jgi:hypothetical protein